MPEEAAHSGNEIPHIANWVALLAQAVGKETTLGQWLHRYEDLVFAGFIALGLCGISWMASRRPSVIPRGWQNTVEWVVESLNRFVEGIMGPQGRHYTPFIGTLFIYILAMNLAGLIPGFKSPTTNINITAGMAICVFLYIQYTGIRSFGFKGYLAHMMGFPQGIGMAIIGILILSIHLIGEFVKPVSLSMRLAFNITGEDTFLAVAVRFGPLGILLQLMAMTLGLILGTAQALVFSTLSAVFISMVLPEHSH
jgi:F-type H+-transporting ATPase subunit a